MSELDGLGRAMPWTFAAFFLASISLIGLPPLGGTWSKWLLLLGAAEADQVVAVIVLLVGSLLAMAYLVPIPARAFFRPPPQEADHGEARPVCSGPSCSPRSAASPCSSAPRRPRTPGRDGGAAVNEPDRRWLDDPRNVTRVVYTLGALCALLLLGDFLYTKKAHFDIEEIFGFYALYGFLGSVGLVLASKGLRRVLRRDEDYYEAACEPADGHGPIGYGR